MSAQHDWGDVDPQEYRRIVAAEMREKELQEQVRRIAIACGWLFYHPWRSDHSAAGYPDCHCIRGDRHVVMELKRENKAPTDVQRQWLEAFEGIGAEVYIIRPSDLLRGFVHEILEATT